MRVLLPNHFPLEGSGSGIYTQNVAREITNKGHEALVVTPAHDEQEGFPFEVRTILFAPDGVEDISKRRLPFNFPCFTTHPLSTTTFADLDDSQRHAYVQAFQAAIDSAVLDWNPEVTHAQHLWVTGYAAHKAEIPYVVTAHGTDLMGFRIYEDWKAMALEGGQHAQTVIAISKQVARDAIELYESIVAHAFRLIPVSSRHRLFLRSLAYTITEFRLIEGSLLLHEICIVIIIDKSYDAGDARLTVDETPRKTSDLNTLIKQQIYIPAETFGMDDPFGEHLDMHELVLVIREYFLDRFLILRLEMRLRFFCLARHPRPDDGVHRMIGTAAINPEPFQFFIFAPLCELAVRARMLHHIPDFIGDRLVPTIAVIAGVDEQDVTFSDLDTFLYHFGSVDVVIAGGI